MRIARNSQRAIRAIRKALQGSMKTGNGEDARVCVFRCNGEPVVKVCHCHTQIAYDFLTHRLNFELVSEFVDAIVLKGP